MKIHTYPIACLGAGLCFVLWSSSVCCAQGSQGIALRRIEEMIRKGHYAAAEYFATWS